MDNTRLLIADDHAPHRALVHAICEREGWQLDEALDGVSAIKRFRRNGYRLVLLNPVLPELDGMNVLIQLRHVSDVPIFLLCDAPNETQCLEGYRLGADEVIHMPIGGEELAARIKVFLRRTGTQVAAQTPRAVQGAVHRHVFPQGACGRNPRSPNTKAVCPAGISRATPAPGLLARGAARRGVGG